MSSRRKFMQQGGASFLSFLLLSNNAFAEETTNGFEGLVVNEDEGEAVQLRDGAAIVRIKISKIQGAGSVSFLSESFGPGDAIPVHKHTNEDELIFIHKGSGIFTLGEKEYPVNEGAVAIVPKTVWHGLKNNGTGTLEMRFAYSPSGFEGWFREWGTPVGKPFVKRSVEEKKAIARKWGMIYKS